MRRNQAKSLHRHIRQNRQYRNMVSDQVVSRLSIPTKAGASFAAPSIVGLSRNSLSEAIKSIEPDQLHSELIPFPASAFAVQFRVAVPVADWNDDVHVVNLWTRRYKDVKVRNCILR